MKKLLYILTLSALFLFPNFAKADFELAQGVLTNVQGVANKVNTASQEIATARDDFNSMLEGPNKFRNNYTGIVKDFTSKLGIDTAKRLMSAVNPEISNVNNNEETQKNIKNDMLLKIGQGEETSKSQQHDIMMKLINGENSAILYAKSLTTRTNLAMEEPPVFERGNTQEIIRSTTAMTDSIARRYNSIWDLEAAYMEYFASDLSKEFNFGGEEEEKDEINPMGEKG